MMAKNRFTQSSKERKKEFYKVVIIGRATMVSDFYPKRIYFLSSFAALRLERAARVGVREACLP